MEHFQVWGFFSLIALTIAVTDTYSSSHEPTYLLVTPPVVPGIPISVSVTTFSVSLVNVSIQITLGDEVLSSNSSQFRGGETKLLMLPPIQGAKFSIHNRYILGVQGHIGDDLIFFNSTHLTFNLKSVSTFIQTDKPRYLPGQEVKIRVVSVFRDGKPYNSPVDIVIKDPRGNILRKWVSLESVLGVVSKEFQLSENPPLGKWTVVTHVNDVMSEAHFSVAHYVLPKFEVLIDAPKVIYQTDTLSGSVTAKYLYGKPVQGHMNITFVHHFHGMIREYREDREIDGTEDFMFDVPDYMARRVEPLEPIYYEESMNHESIKIVVSVTDDLTGLTYYSTAKVPLENQKYKLSFINYDKILRPLYFTAKLKISTYNDQPLSLEDQQKMVQVTVLQQRASPMRWRLDMEEQISPRANTESPRTPGMTHRPEENQPVVMEFPVPADGVIPLSIHVMNDTETLSIDAYFEDSQKMLQLYRDYRSPSLSYLQIEKPSRPLQADSPSTLQIQRNFQMSKIHYIVKSRGLVVSAGTSYRDLTLVPQVTWGPEALLIVYCLLPNEEMVYDVITLLIDQTLQNQVSLSWSDIRKSPGDEVTLRVSVEGPGSLVGIRVVDKAALLTESDNDITLERVKEEMGRYNTDTSIGSMWKTGNLYNVLMASGLMTLTDVSFPNTVNSLKPVSPGEGIYAMYLDVHTPIHERNNFPETWIWSDVKTSDTTEITFTVPDSITTWVATAFVMSENLGLGVIESPAELTVFQDFFLSLNLPAYVIRGEELLLEILLFNYLPQNLEVMVTVAQSGTFEFVFPDNEFDGPTVRRVPVRSNSGKSVLIPIRPLVLGEIPISVKATSSAGSDLVRRMLIVKAEGLEQSYSTSLLFDVQNSVIPRPIMFTFPADVVEGSERASLTAIGDIMGPSISGLESLIRMPYGCGEQNMINFAPNIYVLWYLTSRGEAEQETSNKAKDYMMKGYERELTYQRNDGSFSAFGNNDLSGSTWLTAFVLKCFLQARPFITIDTNILNQAAAWLIHQQGADGSFEDRGRVIHTEMQGGVDGPVSLTAYVLIALLEDSNIKAQYESQVSAALLFLETRLALGVPNNYSLSLLSYALAQANSSNTSSAVDELIGRAEMKDGMYMWSTSTGGLTSSWQPRTTDIEMAAYVLLTLHRLGRITDSITFIRWLSRQRNPSGGFGSTQDTVVALEAMSSFASSFIQMNNFNLAISVSSNTTDHVAYFTINQQNYLVKQSQEIEPERELYLTVTAAGFGIALVQLNVFYNIRNEALTRRKREAGEHEPFHLYIELHDDELTAPHLYICTRLSEGLGLYATGMAIMEVGLLSGFSLKPDYILNDGVVRKVETEPGKVILYLDSVTLEEICLEIPLVLEYKVGKVQEATVTIYDYYEPRRRTVKTYSSERRHEMSTCSFCGDDCSECMGDDFDYDIGITSSSSQNVLLSILAPTLIMLYISIFGL